MNPKARTTDLITEESVEGMVIYDLERDKVHALNETAAIVFRASDGETDLSTIAEILQQKLSCTYSPDLVLLALRRLEKSHLLESAPNTEGVSRREVLASMREMGKVGVGISLLPVISTIIAPSPVYALSQLPPACHPACDPSDPGLEVCLNPAGMCNSGNCTAAGSTPFFCP